jgi:hypothetical protein
MSVHSFCFQVDLFRPASNTATTSTIFIVVTKGEVAPVHIMQSYEEEVV